MFLGVDPSSPKRARFTSDRLVGDFNNDEDDFVDVNKMFCFLMGECSVEEDDLFMCNDGD